MKQEIAKEIFNPVNKKFDRIQIQTHYKNECWSIDLIDKTILAKYKKNYVPNLPILNMHGPLLLKICPEEVKQLHSRNLMKKKGENRMKFDMR